VAAWADGLLTTKADLDSLRRIIEAFRANGGAGKPVHVKVDLSWAPSEEQALQQAHEQWRYLVPGRTASQELDSPEAFDAASRDVTPDDVRHSVFVSARLDDHVEWLRQRLALGVTTLDIHDVGRNQAEFIAAFGREVLPALR
jgi:hypothetical protein